MSYLALKRAMVLQHVEQLGVVNLEQHASDLTSHVWVHPLDQREQSLTQHLLLLLWRSCGQHSGSQWLLTWDLDRWLRHGRGDHSLAWHTLDWRVPGRLGVLEGGLLSHLGVHLDRSHAWSHHHLWSSSRHHLRSGSRWSRHARCSWSHWSSWSASHVHAWHGLRSGSSHAWLRGPPGLSPDLSWSEESLRLRHGGHEVSSHPHLLHPSHPLHPHPSHALDVLTGQVSLAVLLPLGQGNVQRLGHDDATVHLGDSLGGLLWRRETDESESLGSSLLAHDLGRGDGSIWSELLSQPLIINGVVEVLDVEVDSLVPVESLHLELLELLLQLGLSLSLLLSSANIQSLASDLLTIEFLHRLLS